MSTTAPALGFPGAGFLFPVFPIPSNSFPPLAWHPMASRRHFCARVQRGRGEAKK
nr:MAG TPA: hypothetical protein [Caudoviricetes sp.]